MVESFCSMPRAAPEFATIHREWLGRFTPSENRTRESRVTLRVGHAKSLSKFHVRAQARHDDRSPIAVVSGIVYVLHTGSHIDPAPDVHRVIRFNDVLPAVMEPAVA